jgi:hypothetical protein
MALTDAFLATCRVAINSLPELAAFRSANALTDHTRVGREAAFGRAFGSTTSTPSPAYNLALAIRVTVGAQADASGALGALDRESAVSTLTAEYLPAGERPPSQAEEAAATEALLLEDQLS